MIIIRHIVLFCIFSLSTLGAKSLPEWLSDAEQTLVTEVLPNGLTVMCYPMPDTYEVHVGITYDVGGKDELPHECGLAHMVEHMIFKGTDKMSETDLKAITDRYHLERGSYNATTTSDLTRYFFHADKNSWQVFLSVLADCMTHARFDENHFASEVKAVIEELNLRSTNLGAIIGDELGALIYPHSHPYYHPVGGYKEVLLNATSDDLKEFYKRNYHPAKALLTIVGDVKVADALDAARKAFATERTLKVPKSMVHEIPTADFTQKKITLFKPIPKAQYTYLWKIPSDPQIGEYASCAAWILTKRLEKLLVDEKNLVYSVIVDTFQKQLGGVFLFTFDLKNQEQFKEVKKLITHEIEKLTEEGPTENELHRYKKLVEASYCRQFESCSSLAEALEQQYFPTRSAAHFFSLLDRSQQVTKEGVQDFAKTYIRPGSKYTILCLPILEQEQAHWLAKKQEEDIYEQTILQRKMRETIIEPPRYAQELPRAPISVYSPEIPDKEFTLKNGLKVYVKKRETTPFVSCTLAFKNSELFHIAQSLRHQKMARLFAMDMIPYGSTKYSKEQNQEFFDLKGARAIVSADGAYLSCLPEDFVEVATRGLHMLKEPAYASKILEQERMSLIEQFALAKKRPEYMVDRLLIMELFKEYPWMDSDEELCEQLKMLKRSDLVSFNKRYINPENMFLVFVGTLNLDTIENELESLFGSWKSDKESQPLVEQALKIPDITIQATEVKYPMPVDQVYLALGRVTDYYYSKDILALALIESYLSNKIFAIREQTGAFYAFRSTLSESSVHQKGAAQILVPLSMGNLTLVEDALKELLRKIAQEGIPQEVIDTAKLSFQVQLLKSSKSNDALVSRFAAIISNSEPLDIHARRLAGLQALTKEEIDAVVRKYFDPAQWTTVKVGRMEQDMIQAQDNSQEKKVSKESNTDETKQGFLSWLFSRFLLKA